MAVIALMAINMDTLAADDTIPLDKQVDFILQGIRHERELIETGTFEASGSYLEQGKEWGVLEGELKIFCGFDFPKGKFRFDRQEPFRHGADNTDEKKSRNWEVRYRGGQFARTSDSVTILMIGADHISILPAHRKTPRWSKAFDFRALGLSYGLDINRGTPFPDVWDNYHLFPPSEVFEESSGVYRITWIIEKGGPMRRIMRLDSNKGYWPTHLSLEQKNPSQEQWQEPHFTSDISLTRVNNLWLPEEFRWRTDNISQVLHFKWDRINLPIDDSLFTADGFKLSAANRVVDERLGRPVVIERLSTIEPSPVESGWSRLRWPLIAVNVLVVTILIFLIILQRRSAAA